MRKIIVQWLFKKAFEQYIFPFSRSDEKIQKMNEAQRTEYFRQAIELTENRVYTQEVEEIIRVYYQKLSVKSFNGVEQASYRQALLLFQELDKRIKSQAVLYKAPSLPKTSNLK